MFGYFITLLKIKFLVSQLASKKIPTCNRHQNDQYCANVSPNKNLFKTGPIEQLYQWRSGIVYIIGIFRQTDLGQEAIRLTAGDGGPSTGFQTHSNA